MKNSLQTRESFVNYSSVANPNALLRGSYGPNDFVTYLTLFQSHLYQINNLACLFSEKHEFKANYTGNFSITFTRKGHFTFESFRQFGEEYANRIVLEKPGCQFRCIQQEPGEGSCTVFGFSDHGYNMILEEVPKGLLCYFTDPDRFSAIIDSNAVADYLHHHILFLIHRGDADLFQIDCLVTELVSTIVDLVLDQNALHEPPYRIRRNHLRTIERAKEFLLENYARPISLQELARYCYVSEFHFTRTFKKICGFKPFEYLQQIRLKNAELLLRNSGLPLLDVALQSGFTRADYFSTAFSKKHGISPKKFQQAFL